MIKKVPAAEARTAIITLTGDSFTNDSATFSAPVSSDRRFAVLELINRCRQILIRARAERQVLEDICQVLGSSAVYQMASFASAVPDETKKARRTQHIQFEAGYPDKAQTLWTDSRTKPGEQAMRTKNPQLIHDVFSPEYALQWRETGLKYEFSSVASFPLSSNGLVLGALTVYTVEKNAFQTEETNALIGLAEDIAFTLQQVRARMAQQQNLQQLNISEKYFHGLIEHASDVIMVVTGKGMPSFVSKSVQRMLGYSAAQAATKSLTEYIHPEDKHAVNALLRNAQHTPGLQKTEARFRHKNGTWLHFDCTISNQLHEPDIKGLVINLHDITSLKEAEAKVRQQQQEQQLLFDSVPAIITFKDTYNRILRVNRMAASFYGLSKAEIEGKTLYELNPLFAAKYHKEDIEIITSGVARLDVIEKIMLPNGQTKWLQTNKIPFYDEQGRTTGIIIFAQEITAQRRTEEELRTTLDELKQRNYELDKYFYKVSHDLRAPLCSIEGLVNLMKMENNSAGNIRYLELIERSVTKLDNFIRTILNHSNTLHTTTQVVPIDFPQLINHCLDDLRYLPQYSKIHTSITLQASTNYYNDLTRMGIIFKHLISNSLKFFNPYAEENFLRIHISITAAKAIITLEDNGIGIEKQYLNKVFNMFFKATDKVEGAGLGLYVVKQTIEKLGGSISVKSECGKGTTFRIVLPNYHL